MATSYLEFLSSDLQNPDFVVNYNAGVPSPVKKIDKLDAIEKIRSLMKNKSLIPIPEISDDFILRFLYARKMDIDASFQLLLNYFKYRNGNLSVFYNLSVKDPLIQLAFRDGLPLVLKQRDRKGRCVILFLIYQWDHSKYLFDTIYRALILTLEYLLENAQNRVNGFVFVIDWSNLKLRDCMDLNPRILKLIIDGFQDSFPAKVKGIHFVGQPWYIDGILSVTKPFLKDKTKQKFVVHGTNLCTLHEYLPRDVVPPELGGEGTSYTPAELIDVISKYNERLNQS